MTATSHSLYERWLEVAREHASSFALAETQTGCRWSFAELRAEAERAPSGQNPVEHPQGHGANFVLTLLRTWRDNAIACPIETGQNAPALPAPPLCAHLKLTSGSTGAAKCVAFTAPQLAADARNIVGTMGLRPDWPNLGVISLAHSYGFSNLVLPLLLHGIPLIVAPAPLPETVLQAAARFGSITLPAVPALWRTWFASQSIPKNVRLAISAGAPLPLDLEGAVYAKCGLKIHNFYGSTECGGIAYDRSSQPRPDPSLAGSALDGVRLAVGESGALVVSGAAVGETYWPQVQAELGHGSFVTTDLAEIVDGAVFLKGRISEVINVAGRKVAPEVVEHALRAHPMVLECVVFGVPSTGQERLETIVAVVNSADSLAGSDLGSFLSARLPGWQIPRKWWFCGELQPNQRGKISRSEWRSRYLARTA